MDVADHRSHLPEPLFELASRFGQHAEERPNCSRRCGSSGARASGAGPRAGFDARGGGTGRRVESGSVIFTHEPEIAQGTEGFEGPSLPQLRSEAAVDQLEKLDRELDISDPAA